MKKLFLLSMTSLFCLGLFAQNAKLNEGFEGVTFPPDGWSIIDEGASGKWEQNNISMYAIAGKKSAIIKGNFTTALDDWLITPKLIVQNGDSLTFKAKITNYSGSVTYDVKVSTTDTKKASFTNNLATGVSANKTAAKQSYDLSSYNGQSVYIAIVANYTSYKNLVIDEVTGPEVYVPSIDAGITKIINKNAYFGKHDIVVNLKNYGLTELTACKIKYKIDNGEEQTYSWTGNIAHKADKNVTIATDYNFSPAKKYTITAKVELTSDEVSNNNSSTKEVDYYDALNVPISEGFENANSLDDLLGWEFQKLGFGNRYGIVFKGSYAKVNPRTGNRGLGTSFYNSNDWAFTREIAVEKSKTYKFSIWYKTKGTFNTVKVAWGKTKNNSAMTILKELTNIEENTEYQELTTEFTATETGNIVFGIYINDNGTYSNEKYICFDDLEITQIVQKYAVNFEVIGGNGTLTAKVDENQINSADMVEKDKNVVFTATPAEGYQVKEWKLNDVAVADNKTNNYTITGISAEAKVNVEFEKIPPSTYAVNFEVIGGNGTLTAKVDENQINSADKVEKGKNVVFTATPAEGYQVKEWKLNDVAVADNKTNNYTITGISAEAKVNVEFEKIPPSTYVVKFTVKNKNQAVEGAALAINGKTLTTDDKGIATIELASGEYEYTIKKEGFADYSKKIKVEEKALNIDVNLTKVGVKETFAQIQVMPNPVSDKLILEGIENIEIIEIYSLTGKLNKRIEVSFLKRTTIDVSDFNSGIYMLKLSNHKGENHLLKIVKQ